jgi:hypothetical protein
MPIISPLVQYDSGAPRAYVSAEAQFNQTVGIWNLLILSRPSRPVPSRPVPSRPVPSRPVPSRPVLLKSTNYNPYLYDCHHTIRAITLSRIISPARFHSGNIVFPTAKEFIKMSWFFYIPLVAPSPSCDFFMRIPSSCILK